LFGTVILGMLWKRATPAGGFWGFLAAIVFSMGMWVFVHTFPEGSKPYPTAVVGNGAVVSVVKAGDKITEVIVESGEVKTTNADIKEHGNTIPAHISLSQSDLTLAATQGEGTSARSLRVLVPDAVDAVTKEHAKFGVEGVSLALKPGVTVQASYVSKKFDAASLNPAHTKYVARSDKAKGMAVNMYSGFWSLVVCMGVTILVSLFTKPKPAAELKDLVFGLTEIPASEVGPWYSSPKLWAGVVFVVLVAINIIFW